MVELTHAGSSYCMALTELGLTDEYSRESYEGHELTFHVTPYVAIVVLITSGVVNKLTDGIVRLIRKRKPTSYLPSEEIAHQVGSYGVARLAVSEKIIETTPNLGNTGLGERGVTILAIERMDTVIPFPRDDEKLLAGDYLLCYGKVADLI